MSFEEGEHTADILMHIRAPDLCSLFIDAGRALMKTMYQGEGKPIEEVSLSVTGETPDQLLHGYLSELLFESEVQNLVFSDFAIEIRDGELHATVRGEPFNREMHGGGTEVKGISWYGLSITRMNDEYSCDILFDV